MATGERCGPAGDDGRERAAGERADGSAKILSFPGGGARGGRDPMSTAPASPEEAGSAGDAAEITDLPAAAGERCGPAGGDGREKAAGGCADGGAKIIPFRGGGARGGRDPNWKVLVEVCVLGGEAGERLRAELAAVTVRLLRWAASEAALPVSEERDAA